MERTKADTDIKMKPRQSDIRTYNGYTMKRKYALLLHQPDNSWVLALAPSTVQYSSLGMAAAAIRAAH